MAVYTPLSAEDIAALLARYEIGAALSCEGIAEGVENTNYKLTTATGRYILTLFERRVAEADLPFFMGVIKAGIEPLSFTCLSPVITWQPCAG